MSGASSKRGRPTLFTPDTKQKRRKESSAKTQQTRIILGTAFPLWMKLKQEKGFLRHEQFAEYLMDTLRKFEEMQTNIEHGLLSYNTVSSQEMQVIELLPENTEACDALGDHDEVIDLSETIAPVTQSMDECTAGSSGISVQQNTLLQNENKLVTSTPISSYLCHAVFSSSSESSQHLDEYSSSEVCKDTDDASFHFLSEHVHKSNPEDTTMEDDVLDFDIDDGDEVDEDPEVTLPSADCLAKMTSYIVYENSLMILLHMFFPNCFMKRCENNSEGSWNSSSCVYHMYKEPHMGLVVTTASGPNSAWQFNAVCINFFLSGNNFSKIALMLKFLNLKCVRKTIFFQMQKKYIVPSIIAYWADLQNEIISTITSPIILMGDGRK
ncbi:uncharacterized protein LOC142503179 [Ascaphus truei]|uniref:uncharacterized protein LOC142503179 n=1 Tax=Ascaphus truei TaxID=8439 RepID=UPI003F5ABE94